MPELSALIERLEKASGPDDALNREVCIAAGVVPRIEAPFNAAGEGVEVYPPVMWSIDAALAFVERVLPGSYWRVARHEPQLARLPGSGPFWASVGAPGEQEGAWGNTAPLAILIASLKALQEREGEGRATDML